jgi:hypothetical protein
MLPDRPHPAGAQGDPYEGDRPGGKRAGYGGNEGFELHLYLWYRFSLEIMVLPILWKTHRQFR